MLLGLNDGLVGYKILGSVLFPFPSPVISFKILLHCLTLSRIASERTYGNLILSPIGALRSPPLSVLFFRYLLSEFSLTMMCLGTQWAFSIRDVMAFTRSFC